MFYPGLSHYIPIGFEILMLLDVFGIWQMPTKARHLHAVVRLVWLQPRQHPGDARLRDRRPGSSGCHEYHVVGRHRWHHGLHLGLFHHQKHTTWVASAMGSWQADWFGFLRRCEPWSVLEAVVSLVDQPAEEHGMMSRDSKSNHQYFDDGFAVPKFPSLFSSGINFGW